MPERLVVFFHIDITGELRNAIASILGIEEVGSNLQRSVLPDGDYIVFDLIVVGTVACFAATILDRRVPCPVDDRSRFAKPVACVPNVVALDPNVFKTAGVALFNVAHPVFDRHFATLNDVIFISHVLHIEIVAQGRTHVVVVRLHRNACVINLIDVVILTIEPVASAVDLNGIAKPRLVISALNGGGMRRSSDPTELAVGHRQTDLRVGPARSDAVYPRIFDAEVIERDVIRFDQIGRAHV